MYTRSPYLRPGECIVRCQVFSFIKLFFFFFFLYLFISSLARFPLDGYFIRTSGLARADFAVNGGKRGPPEQAAVLGQIAAQCDFVNGIRDELLLTIGCNSTCETSRRTVAHIWPRVSCDFELFLLFMQTILTVGYLTISLDNENIFKPFFFFFNQITFSRFETFLKNYQLT